MMVAMVTMDSGGPARVRGHRILIVLLGALLLVGCTSSESDGTGSRGVPTHRTGCGPIAFSDVRGRVPSYVDHRLDRFSNDHEACAGLWLAAADAAFVAQGLAVSGHVAWVSGFPGDQPVGQRLCRIQRVDLRTGRTLTDLDPLSGAIGTRPSVACRHGGGLTLDRHGLWVAELERLWLLDPDDLSVRRAWDVVAPLRGSYAVTDDRGRLGLGRFRAHGRTRLDWLDPAALLASPDVSVTRADVVASRPAPAGAQGAVWARLGGAPAGLWFATSTTRCGILVGPGGRRVGFVPGAEGLALAGRDRLWAVSESATEAYQREGGRPVVPMLSRFDTSELTRWTAPDCAL